MTQQKYKRAVRLELAKSKLTKANQHAVAMPAVIIPMTAALLFVAHNLRGDRLFDQVFFLVGAAAVVVIFMNGLYARRLHSQACRELQELLPDDPEPSESEQSERQSKALPCEPSPERSPL